MEMLLKWDQEVVISGPCKCVTVCCNASEEFELFINRLYTLWMVYWTFLKVKSVIYIILHVLCINFIIVYIEYLSASNEHYYPNLLNIISCNYWTLISSSIEQYGLRSDLLRIIVCLMKLNSRNIITFHFILNYVYCLWLTVFIILKCYLSYLFLYLSFHLDRNAFRSICCFEIRLHYHFLCMRTKH